MTDHEHHHHDGEECHCHDHEHDHHHEHDHEATSIEQAGGCAVGLTGTITCWNADAEARFAKALERVGKWVEHEAGCMLGHIKAAVTLDDGSGMTLNLINMENGVEHHGSLEPSEKVNFTFMCAVLDVDEHDLRHMMFHAVDDTGLDYTLDEHVECHCHDHDHDHEHGECHDHDHEHEHHHHHHDGEECHCHDHDHEHHDHDHDHEHGECHCHDHDHHHHHDGE